jgi:hypothetical protein
MRFGLSLTLVTFAALPSFLDPAGAALAQDLRETAVLQQDTVADEEPGLHVGHGDKGFEFSTKDGNYLLQLQFRFQFRYAYPGDADPVTFDDFREGDEHVFKVNRARMKVGGNAYRPWLKYYMEYELAAGNLLDFRFMLERLSYLNLAADFNYWASVLTGTGRGARENDDEHLMWMVRGQWNFLGQEVGFSGSDVDHHEKGAGLLALAAVTNRSPYTRFSQAGGGQLEGFEEGEPGQYRVDQWMEETALKYRGLSWQQEFHWKRIKDFANSTTTTLVGNYAQIGYFFHYAWSAIPKPLEVAVLYAFYDPNVDQRDNLRQELSLAVNWFFAGHRNKLTTDLTYFALQDPSRGEEEDLRFRLQWDISI